MKSLRLLTVGLSDPPSPRPTDAWCAAVKSPLILTTEEYLHSVISLINELSRLAVNSVTLQQFSVPVGVCRFCKDLSAGFGMLNLKNDNLRKRFDAIKVRRVFHPLPASGR